ncbi:MAG: peptide chain release factor N(5)-glutamine methyltransferase [Rickettsiaceae bacterium]
MLIKEALSLATEKLESFSSKQLEARILLSYALNITQETLLINYNKEITEDEKLNFFKYIERRKSFEPIAYILEKKEFYGMDFFVDQNVLIPRPDTETIVDEVILEYNKNFPDKEITILDLGTGSGAIAVSLATVIPLSKITATDVSDEVLKIATKNAISNSIAAQIEFIQSNWYSNLSNNKFDFIVSNPPYINSADKSYMSQETLLYEPQDALFADDNGLINYSEIISGAISFLNLGGKIFLEIGFNQSKAVVSILEKYHFTEITIVQDLSGQDRIIKATHLYE